MTKEEAIEAIKCNWPDSRYTILREALDMAISALREQDVADKDAGKNEPLTLDELRKMDGEPVWVVCLTPEIYDEPPIRWRILEKSIIGTFGVWGNKDSCLTERDYGKTWIAYRHKPEEGTV